MKSGKKKRVVVTGIGVFSSIGRGKEEFMKAMFNGESGVKEIELFNAENYRTDKAAYINTIPVSGMNERDRIYKILDVISDEAVKDAKINFNTVELRDVGVSMGTCLGNVDCLDRYLSAKVLENDDKAEMIIDQPHLFPATYIARKYAISNIAITVDTACASGTNSIGCAFDRIRSNHAKIMIAGGIDIFSRLTHSGFGSLKSLTTTKTRPFTKERDGLVLGEGGAVVILEELSHAIERKATIYAEVLGYGLSNDAYHETTPDPEGKGAQRAIEACLKDADIEASEVDYINAHGTGTQFNDKMEIKAISAVFGERALKMPISTIKPMIGHTLGAGGSIEFVATALSMMTSTLPPTINFTTPIDGYEDYDFVPNKARRIEQLEVAISNSFAFGGNTACIALGHYGS